MVYKTQVDLGPFVPQQKLDELSTQKTPDGQETELYDRWLAEPTPKNVEPLLATLKPTIDSALHSYVGGDPERFRPRAELLAVQAMKTYDPRKGTQLKSHVYTSLQRLNREKADRSQLIHIPENVSLERNTIQKAVSEFEADHGRSPSQSELADKTGISVKRMTKISQYKNQAMESQFLSDKGDSMYPNTPGDDQRIWIDYVYNELDPVDQKILEWSTGYGGTKPIPKKEMAKRLRISAPAVSARINRIVKKLEAGINV